MPETRRERPTCTVGAPPVNPMTTAQGTPAPDGATTDRVGSRFTANRLTWSASADDAGRYYGQCPAHRDRRLVLDFDPADDVMRLHTGPCGCLPGEVIRQLDLGAAVVPNVPPSVRTDRARRLLGVRTAYADLAGVDDPYTRITLALEAAGMAGTRADPGAVRGQGRYQCPACGAKGDGHGLHVWRRDDGTAGFTCYACKAPGDEIRQALGLTPQDMGWSGKPLPGVDFDGPGGGAEDPEEAARLHYESEVRQELRKQRVRLEAQRRLNAEQRPTVAPPEILTLRERLARPRQPVTYRIDGWQPAGSRVVLAAQFKAGKTTLVGNLVRCVLDGTPWLGRHGVSTVQGTVVMLDFEMSGAQLDQWLSDQGVVADDRLIPIPLRGNAASFDILDPPTLALWGQRLKALNCQYLVLDCLRPVLDALGLDEHRDAGRFLTGFDALLAVAQIGDAAVVHHMGHNGERSRGDSRIRDWPDVEWRLVRQDDDPASPRFISAYGRDVDVAESQLQFDSATRRLTLLGGSRKGAAERAALTVVLEVLDREPGISGRAIEDALSGTEHSRSEIRAGLKLGIREGWIKTERGPRGAILHSQCASPPDCADSAPARSSECASAPIDGALHSDTQTGASAPTAKPPGRPQSSSGCARWLSGEGRFCGATEQLRRYQSGHLCPTHQPEGDAA